MCPRIKKFLFVSLVILLTPSIQAWGMEEETYVFYRGYHFLKTEIIAEGIFNKRGISSKPVVQNKMTEEEIKDAIAKINSLNRFWTKEEKRQIKPSCDTPYQELIQLYTNSYKKFVGELSNQTSKTRQILRLAGLDHIDTNLFISTSLKASQAYCYGAGLKLYDAPGLQRYPSYSNDDYKPQDPILGYVDVIIIPKKDIKDCGAFFVVDSFAIGCTKLSHHFNKNLTEEMEVIFPFLIADKFHRARVPIQFPSLQLRGLKDGLQHAHWRKSILAASTVEEQQEIELRFVKAAVLHLAKKLESEGGIFLKQNGKTRVTNGPSLAGLEHALVPAEAALVRKRILSYQDKMVEKCFNKQSKQFRVPLTSLNFYLSHSLKRLARSNHPITIVSKFSMKTINFELMRIFLDEDTIEKIEFKGDPVISNDLCATFVGMDITDGKSQENADALWFYPQSTLVKDFIRVSIGRKQNLILDVTGLGLAPKYFELEDPKAPITLIDSERVNVETAYTWLVDGMDWYGDYVRKEMK